MEQGLSYADNAFYVSEVLVCVSWDFSVTNMNNLYGCKSSISFSLFCDTQITRLEQCEAIRLKYTQYLEVFRSH